MFFVPERRRSRRRPSAIRAERASERSNLAGALACLACGLGSTSAI
jgi:hypothetical protein